MFWGGPDTKKNRKLPGFSKIFPEYSEYSDLLKLKIGGFWTRTILGGLRNVRKLTKIVNIGQKNISIDQIVREVMGNDPEGSRPCLEVIWGQNVEHENLTRK